MSITIPPASDGIKSGCQIFVNNISNHVTVRQLKNLFSKFGRLTEVKIVSHFGFVTFVDPQCASEAVTQLHDQVLEGRRLAVEIAQDSKERIDKCYNCGIAGHISARCKEPRKVAYVETK